VSLVFFVRRSKQARDRRQTITDEEIRTNYITLPHFVTLKDEIMRTLQNKRPINPNKKIMLKKHQEFEQLKY
jgi:hypothetical protein